MALTEKFNHAAEALARMLAQDKDRPNLEDMIALVLVPEIQELEEALFEILDETPLAVAIGTQLDNIGTLVALDRQGFNDVDYRVRLGVKILVNIAEGTLEEFITILDLLTGGGLTIHVTEDFPAHFDADIEDPLPVGINGPAAAKFALLAKPAAVKGIVTYHVADPFQYDAATFGYDLGKYGGADGV